MSANPIKKHLITAALPYANGPIHIGHLAGAYLPADIYVRYLRLKGENPLFICGSDEHGAAITLRAKKENKTPQQIVDEFHTLNKKAFEDFGITFDIFHRTSSELHHQTAQEFFLDLEQKGAFEVKKGKQFYDEDYKQFLADRYITGSCPKCQKEGAYGDQCESCGSSLNPNDLINPISTLSGKPPVLKETTHWYLPMQKEEEWLRKWIEEGTLDGKQHHDPKAWRKPVIGQCKSWIDGGLQSRAMTRDLDWGVKVPLKEAAGKVLYVWLDAPIGYISATKAWAEANGEKWEDYWQNEASELVHFIGKDNIVFHCIIFPILLKKHGKFNLPVNVPANEFLNLEGKKISTSRNWAVWLHEFMEDMPDKQDVLRYTLCSIAPETKDSEFTWQDFQARNNNELVAIYGNFVNRSVVLTHKYFDGKVPTLKHFPHEYQSIVDQMQAHVDSCTQKIENKQFREAQYEAISIARLGNKFLAETEPWKLIKTDLEQVAKILNLSLQIAANACIALAPFLPDSSSKLAEMLGLNEVKWSDLGGVDLVNGGSDLGKAEHLFAKIEADEIQKQVEKLEAKAQPQDVEEKETEKEIAPVKDLIEFDDFVKLDIRIGTIKSAEKMPKSNKMLKLQIDLGNEERTILSGIAKNYSTEELIDQQVQVVVNLAPRKMMGVLSEGMVLMAESADGSLALLSPNQKVSEGSTVS
ncbi:MAG: methionine--tRNA ligase [Vicingaceae bacterium]